MSALTLPKLPNNNAVRAAFWGQTIFMAALVVCFTLRPQFLRSEGGFSNYGVTAVTVAPFTVAFVAASVGSWISAQRLAGQRSFIWALRILAALFLAVMLSTYPYKLNSFYDQLHQLAGIALFAYELGMGVWFVIKRPNLAYVGLFVVQLAGNVAGLVTILGKVHLLFVSQFVVGLAFGILLVRSISQRSSR